MSNSQSCQYGHTPTLQRDGIGENILYGQSSPEQMTRQMWYDDELNLYDFGHQGFSGSTGHLTQMIWKTTTEVGCMVRKCTFGTYVKCDYRKKGNIQGQFEQNCNAPRNGYSSSTPKYPNDQNNNQNYQNYQSATQNYQANKQDYQNYQNYATTNQNYQNYADQSAQTYQEDPIGSHQTYRSYQSQLTQVGSENKDYQSHGPVSNTYSPNAKGENGQETKHQKISDPKTNCQKPGDKEDKGDTQNHQGDQDARYKRPVYSPLYESSKGQVYDITNPNNFNMVPGETYRNIVYD